MLRRSEIFKYFILTIALFLQIGCNFQSQDQQKGKKYPHEITPAFHAKLHTELNGNPEILEFGQILFLEINQQEEILLTDVQRNIIYKLDLDGKKHNTFHNPGRGPGEFLSMDLVSENYLGQTGIYDYLLRRLTIMDSDLETVQEIYNVEGPSGITLRLLGFSETGAFFSGFKGFTLFNYEEERKLNIYFFEFGKEKIELLFSLPANEWLPVVNTDQRRIGTYIIPFGRRVKLIKDKNNLIYLSNQGFGYSIYDSDGNITQFDSLYYDFQSYSFNQKQIQQHLDKMLPPGLPLHRKNEILDVMWNSVETKDTSLFHKGFIDTEGRIWFELYSELFKGESRCIVWDRKKEKVFQVIFDEDDVHPQVVIKNTVIAFKRNEFDLETVRLYTFSEEVEK